MTVRLTPGQTAEDRREQIIAEIAKARCPGCGREINAEPGPEWLAPNQWCIRCGGTA